MSNSRTRLMVFFSIVATVSGFTACSKPPAAEHAEGSSEETASGESPADESGSADDGESAARSATAETDGESENAEPAQSAPPLSTLCKTMCGAQSSECKPNQVAECERNYCDRYGNAPKVCAPSARAALECAKAEPDFLLCAHVVPDSCAKKFRATEDCLTSGVAPVEVEEGPNVPEGWAKYEARDAGFTVTMPKGVKVTSEGGVRVWSAESGGVRYEIRREPKPDEKKFDQRGFLRVATKLLGKCAPRMKLYSLVETDERSIIQFQTKCPDNTQQRGALYVHGDAYFVVRATWGAEPNPHGDTFAYSFEHH